MAIQFSLKLKHKTAKVLTLLT